MWWPEVYVPHVEIKKMQFRHPGAIASFVCTVVSISYQYNCLWSNTNKLKEQAGAELCHAQFKLGLGKLDLLSKKCRLS